VTSAIYQAADALTLVASANYDAIHLAGQAQRFHVRMESMLEGLDVTRAFAPSSRLLVGDVKHQYCATALASCAVVDALGDPAPQTEAPSRILTLNCGKARHSPSSRSGLGFARPRPGDS
jgi:hypothetical protein